MDYLCLFRINLSGIENGFCLILDDPEMNYRERRGIFIQAAGIKPLLRYSRVVRILYEDSVKRPSF
jgi:hypothetical protein